MVFNKLDDNDKSYIIKVYLDKSRSWGDRIKTLSDKFEVTERTLLTWVKKLEITEKGPLLSEQFLKATQKKYDKSKNIVFITWAQCNTPEHKGMLKNMESYADFHGAGIHVIAGRYKNPTSLGAEHKIDRENEERWSERLEPYLDANRHDIHKYVSILSDVKIQPTAAFPMNGLQGLSGVNSCIFGAPKSHMEVVPVLEGQKPKIMLTTGAITAPNYTQTKAGKKGEFHHTYGFVIVEIKDNETFFVRQVNVDPKTGDFYDLYFNVKDGVVSRNETVEAAILGDIHLGMHNETIIEKTFKELFVKLKPKKVVIHDLFDGHSISHHESKNPFILYKREQDGTNSLKRELDNMIEWVGEYLTPYNTIVVRSNHDDFIDRWLINNDWKKNIKNSLEYIKYAQVLLEGDAPKGILPYIINKHYPKITTLDRNSSYKIKGWEVGNHGDLGTNGSRGSLLQFRKLNVRCIVGHYHSPGRKDNALAVGTSTKLRMGYNLGPSNWLHSHILLHTDASAQHIHFINDEYTTFT